MNIHGHLFDISKTMPCIAATVILIADLCFVSMLPINEMSKLLMTYTRKRICQLCHWMLVSLWSSSITELNLSKNPFEQNCCSGLVSPKPFLHWQMTRCRSRVSPSKSCWKTMINTLQISVWKDDATIANLSGVFRLSNICLLRHALLNDLFTTSKWVKNLLLCWKLSSAHDVM